MKHLFFLEAFPRSCKQNWALGLVISCDKLILYKYICYLYVYLWHINILRHLHLYMKGVCVQLCLTYCDSRDCSLSGSAVHGISQARILEWAAISSSRGSSWPRDQTSLSYICSIGRQILYCWVNWEAHLYITRKQILLSVVRLYINLYNIYA